MAYLINTDLVEQYWYEYKDIARAIKYRRFMLNSCEDDTTLKRLVATKIVLDDLYNSFTEDIKMIVNYMYLNKNNDGITWQDVQKRFNLSASSCHLKKKFIAEKTALTLNLI